MSTIEGDLEIVCPGMLAGVLEVLSVGKGDIKLVVGGTDNPEEIAKARMIIETMLKSGYGIFVETGDGLQRIKRFNPERMTYVISEVVDDPALPAAPARPELEAGPPVQAEPAETRENFVPPRRRTREREVPVAGTKAKAIGRTAGG